MSSPKQRVKKNLPRTFLKYFYLNYFLPFLTHCILWPYGKVEINGILGYFWRSYSTKVGIVPIKSLCEVSRKSKREYFFLLMLIIDNYLYVFRNVHKNLNSFEPSYVRYVWDFLHCIESFISTAGIISKLYDYKTKNNCQL